MSFVHQPAPAARPRSGEWFVVVSGERVLARVEGDRARLPVIGEIDAAALAAEPPVHVGRVDGDACWLGSVRAADPAPPPGWTWEDTRAVFGLLPAGLGAAVTCARALHWWSHQHRYCGCCGTATVDAGEERAKRCPRCGALFFASAAPAVIVAVTRGDRILLAHNRKFRPQLYSVLAGFVEPGETLEQAAAREVREEAGIEVGDFRYVASQPWPFPNSLMVGFRAAWHAGDLRPDGREIEELGWYAADALPALPRIGSISRALIEDWRREQTS